jgi:hypothetical protein
MIPQAGHQIQRQLWRTLFNPSIYAPINRAFGHFVIDQ